MRVKSARVDMALQQVPGADPKQSGKAPRRRSSPGASFTELKARLKREARIVGDVLAHPATPWYAKAWLGLLGAYLASPIDLTPDFIPLFGWIDDIVVLAVGLWAAARLVPAEIWQDCRNGAAPFPARLAVARALMIAATWGVTLLMLTWWLWA